MSGSIPVVAMKSAACPHRDTASNVLPGSRFSRTPCTAIRLKKTKQQAPAMAAKVATILMNTDGLICHRPEEADAKSSDHGRFRPAAYAENTSTMALNFPTNTSPAETG